jgi:hypothetical protein
MKISRQKKILQFIVFGTVLSASFAANASADLRDSIRSCSETEDAGERLSCFDRLSSSINEQTDDPVESNARSGGPAAENPDTEPASASGAAIESGSFGNENPRIQVKSVACQRDKQGEYTFRFDNDEVWRQVGSHRYRLSGCEFSATISRDFFGYRMHIEGDDKKMRVKRVR